MIDGVAITIDLVAVVVTSRAPLTTVSSAVVGGGSGVARSIVNLHVPKNFACEDPAGVVADFAQRQGLPAPWIGLMTSAWTEKAEIASDARDGLGAIAVVTVGLGNPIAAGRSGVAATGPSTINTIVIVDAAPEPAALVNLVTTATEVKTMTLVDAGLRSPEGFTATGTSTDAVVVAATDRGHRVRYGGPVTDLGGLVARVVAAALERGVSRWLTEHR